MKTKIEERVGKLEETVNKTIPQIFIFGTVLLCLFLIVIINSFFIIPKTDEARQSCTAEIQELKDEMGLVERIHKPYCTTNEHADLLNGGRKECGYVTKEKQYRDGKLLWFNGERWINEYWLTPAVEVEVCVEWEEIVFQVGEATIKEVNCTDEWNDNYKDWKHRKCFEHEVTNEIRDICTRTERVINNPPEISDVYFNGVKQTTTTNPQTCTETCTQTCI